MSNATVKKLLADWEFQNFEGRGLNVEDLCKDHPELLPVVSQKLDEMQQAAAMRTLRTIGADSFMLSTDGQFMVRPTDDNLIFDVSRYRDMTFLARGGVGEVFTAEDEELRRNVAIKFIRKAKENNEQSRLQFAMEGEITARLEHPGVVPVYGIGNTTEGRPFQVMRLIRGESLREAVARHHGKTVAPSDQSDEEKAGGKEDANTRDVLTQRQLLARFVSVCQTVAYAHTRGVIHRDIKPENVMLGQYGETLVVDWGLAIPFEKTQSDLSAEETLQIESVDALKSTNTGVSGTPSYMSPEQAIGLSDIGPTSDIYSLGSTLYEILTGEVPYQARRARDVVAKVRHGDFSSPRAVNPNVPRALEAICLKAMAKDPRDRYQTSSHLAADIDNYLADVPVTAFQESAFLRIARWARNHKSTVHAGLLATVAIVLLSVFFGFRMSRLASQEHEAREQAVANEINAERAREQNLTLSAGFLARAIGYEIDRRWRLLESEVRSDDLRRMILAINADPENEDLRVPLQRWIEDRHALKSDAIANSGWSIFASNGTQVARAPRAASIGRSYRHRDYFHGFGRDKSPDEAVAKAIQPFQYVEHRVAKDDAVYMSCVFESTNTHTLIVAFSTPIWDKPVEDGDREPIGVFSIPLEISHFDLPVNAMMFQLDNDPFENKPGLVIAHPDLGERSEEELPPRIGADLIAAAEQLQSRLLGDTNPASPDSPERHLFLPKFEDPVSGIVSPAAVEPITVQGRPPALGNTGWFVVVREL